MWLHILYSFWKFDLEKQESGYLYFGILRPGSKKENSFLEGLNNAFIEFWSVNIVLMSGTLFRSSMRHAPSCSIALDSALSLTLSLSRISSSEINKCKFKRIKRTELVITGNA